MVNASCLCPVADKSLEFVDFFYCGTADSQADKDRNQLNNNLKIDELETFDSDYLRQKSFGSRSHISWTVRECRSGPCRRQRGTSRPLV